MVFVLNSILLGVGLAMDAFSVSIVNGLNETRMSKGKTLGIAGTYAGFQFAMPMIGWFCVHTIAEAFQAFQKYIPWIALLLLLYIGGKMLLEGIRNQREAGSGDSAHSGELCDEKAAAPENSAELGLTTLLLQGGGHLHRRPVGGLYHFRLRRGQSLHRLSPDRGDHAGRLSGGIALRKEIRRQVGGQSHDAGRRNPDSHRNRNFRNRNIAKQKTALLTGSGAPDVFCVQSGDRV